MGKTGSTSRKNTSSQAAYEIKMETTTIAAFSSAVRRRVPVPGCKSDDIVAVFGNRRHSGSSEHRGAFAHWIAISRPSPLSGACSLLRNLRRFAAPEVECSDPVPIDQSFPPEPGIAAPNLLRELLDGAGPMMIDPQLVAKVSLLIPPHAELMRVVDRPDEAGFGDGLRPAKFRGPARVGFQHAAGRFGPMARGPEGGAADLKAGKMAVRFQDRVNIPLLRREQEFVEIEERDPSRLCRRGAQ